MKYKIIEVEGIDGIERHVVMELEDGGFLTFPAVNSNESYVEFQRKLAEEQK
jgi:hypothetical protein